MNPDHSQLMSFYLRLTRRQREVVYWVCQGLSNAQVADQLCIASSVVAGHLTNIYEELDALAGPDPHLRANRYTLISLLLGFFERHPEMKVGMPEGKSARRWWSASFQSPEGD